MVRPTKRGGNAPAPAPVVHARPGMCVQTIIGDEEMSGVIVMCLPEAAVIRLDRPYKQHGNSRVDGRDVSVVLQHWDDVLLDRVRPDPEHVTDAPGAQAKPAPEGTVAHA